MAKFWFVAQPVRNTARHVGPLRDCATSATLSRESHLSPKQQQVVSPRGPDPPQLKAKGPTTKGKGKERGKGKAKVKGQANLARTVNRKVKRRLSMPKSKPYEKNSEQQKLSPERRSRKSQLRNSSSKSKVWRPQEKQVKKPKRARDHPGKAPEAYGR